MSEGPGLSLPGACRLADDWTRMAKRTRNDHGRRAALIERAEQLLVECRIQRPPVNLIQIARHVGIQCIRELDIRLDGQLFELDGGRYEVILSSQAPYTRRRFTLAHEIGHLLVARDGGDIACGDEATEELCNAVAAELLLPMRFLREVESNKIDVPAIRKVASRFQCSLEAAAWRLLNMGAIEGALLIWRVGTDGRIEVAAAPRTYGFRAPFRIGDTLDRSRPLMEKLVARDSGPIEFIDPLDGKAYSGDFVKFNQLLLMFLEAAVSVSRKDAVGPGGRLVQGELF